MARHGAGGAAPDSTEGDETTRPGQESALFPRSPRLLGSDRNVRFDTPMPAPEIRCALGRLPSEQGIGAGGGAPTTWRRNRLDASKRTRRSRMSRRNGVLDADRRWVAWVPSAGRLHNSCSWRALGGLVGMQVLRLGAIVWQDRRARHFTLGPSSTRAVLLWPRPSPRTSWSRAPPPVLRRALPHASGRRRVRPMARTVPRQAEAVESHQGRSRGELLHRRATHVALRS